MGWVYCHNEQPRPEGRTKDLLEKLDSLSLGFRVMGAQDRPHRAGRWEERVANAGPGTQQLPPAASSQSPPLKGGWDRGPQSQAARFQSQLGPPLAEERWASGPASLGGKF